MLIAYYLLPITYCLLLITYCLLLITHFFVLGQVDVVEWFRAQVVEASRKESAQRQMETSMALKAQLDKSLAECNS